jgi:hypothetical protein
VLGLRKADRRSASFPLAAFFQEFHALEALEDGTFTTHGGTGLEAIMLGHLWMRLKILGGGN